MKTLFLFSIFFSLNSHAALFISTQTPPPAQHVVRSAAISGSGLQLQTDRASFLFPKTILQQAGLSAKELLDLLREYEASGTHDLRLVLDALGQNVRSVQSVSVVAR